MHTTPSPALTEKSPASNRKLWTVGTLTYTTTALAILFGWLLLGDFASAIKDRSVGPVMQLLLKRFGASDMLTALLISSLPPAIGMIVGPIMSYKSDRHRSKWGRRIPFLWLPTVIASLSVFGLGLTPQLAVALHAELGASSPGVNQLALVCFGLFWVLYDFATMVTLSIFGGLINDVVPQQVIGRFYGLFRAVSLIAGMIFNYWLMGKAETLFWEIFLGVGIVYGCGFLMICWKVKEGEYPPPPPTEPVGPGGKFVTAARGYFRDCYGKSYYLWLFGLVAVAYLSFVPVNTFSLFYAKSIEMSTDTYGKCLALTYLISLILSYPLGALADRIHPLRLGLAVIFLYGLICLWGGFFAQTTQAFSIAFIGHGVLSGTWMTATASLDQRLLPRQKFAEYHSAGVIIKSLLSILCGPLIGLFLDTSGHVYRYTFFIGFGCAMVALVAGFVLYRKFMALGGPQHYSAP